MQNKKSFRVEKIAEVIHKELAIVIVKYCQDPRLEKITITHVTISKDLSIAKIYFTNFFNLNIGSSDIKDMLKILKNASNFFKSQLSTKISLRKIPELKFFYDDNTNSGNKIELLLAQLERHGKQI